MKELFSNLLVSSPNGGGLFVIDDNKVIKLDSYSSVGLCVLPDVIIRALQPDSLWICSNSVIEISSSQVSFGDIHDVLGYEGDYYLVGTTGNEVIRIDTNGLEVQRWCLTGEDDSKHVNCLAVWNDKVIYSAFGEFDISRGYKNNTIQKGYVKDLETGGVLISGLSQPHSPIVVGDNLLIANSEMMEIREYDCAGGLLRTKILQGYTRGICVYGNTIFVGLSCSRNTTDTIVETATVVALDLGSWDELGRIAVPAREIYSIVSVEESKRLVTAIASIASYSAYKTEERLTQFESKLIESNEKFVSLCDSTEIRELQLNRRVTELEELVDRSKIQIEQNEKFVSLYDSTEIRGLQLSLRVTELEELVDRRKLQIEQNEMQKEQSEMQIEQNEMQKEQNEKFVALCDATKIRELQFNCRVTELEELLDRSKMQIEQNETQIERMLNSRSWRFTAPLRALVIAKKKISVSLLAYGLKFYRSLPIASYKKQKMKDFCFRYFGFLLKNLDAYKLWKDYENIKNNWGASALGQKTTEIHRNDIIQTNTILPAADGVWEWEDYSKVKARIAKIKTAARMSFQVQPVEMLSISPNSLRDVAKSLKLPPIVVRPEVSIILPIFNNIKLTMECLLSIEENLDNKINFEIIVADDASTDDTAEVLKSIANIRYFRNDENLGFLRNCNRALEMVQGKYTLYLNNDVQVTAGWLEALLNTFEIYPNAGVVGPKFIYPSGHLQEAGGAFMPDGSTTMIGLDNDPSLPGFNYLRQVDYVSGACLIIPTSLVREIGGFSEEFLPCYYEDSDLCLSVRAAGYEVYYNPDAVIIHHLSKTTANESNEFKMSCIAKNVATLQQKWCSSLERSIDPRLITFYLPQFHPVPENDQWWGKGFTEWANVSKARPNFEGHYQPRTPSDLGYYDLRLLEVMQQQAELAQRYGIHGFCFYYYWFDGKRLLERPVEQLLLSDKPDIPFCLCWANENWTRRWDGQEQEILMAQAHTEQDDEEVIRDLIRFFRDSRYIKIDERPLILIYRVTLFPNFSETAARWRDICRAEGVGEIYIAMVESFDLVHSGTHPSAFGCDAAVEFPPQGLAEQTVPSGDIINPDFEGGIADYRDLAVRYATRPAPNYTRFKGVIPGWDNTARRQNNGFCFEHATPGAFQGWLEETINETRLQQFGDERIVFVNAWNEWAEGAYLEPDRRFGHSYLEAVKNATDASRLLNKNSNG